MDADTFTGALGDLLARRTDIIANPFFIKDYGSSELRFTSALYMDRLCIVVRAAEMVWIHICGDIYLMKMYNCISVSVSTKSYGAHF